ncbi:transporter [Algoriphagus sp. A40]|uniref:transporter n=1 Tax=Algoriphagus sp. A40 TaxID=1945863 RepID=UPI0009848777|nr:transporter [Algoriphagus sp. A40]OOG69273.1 transporter [Algoriphagus sp. A40]
MNLKSMFLGLLFASLGLMQLTYAQTPTDGLMMPKGEICIAVIYEDANWDHYWEGTYLRTNGNIGTFNRKMLMPMIVGGITDKINVIVSLPYVKTSASAGQLTGVEGFQDFGISLKAQLVEKTMEKSKLMVFSNLSFSTPASNYLSDYMPFSLGFGANELGLRAIGQYELNKGPYLRGSIAYLHRGATEAERDYYYQDGSYYTATMDVPDAWNAQLALGSWFLDKKLRVEATLTLLNSTSGDDIRAYNAPQPTNKVEYDQVGGFAQYYLKKGGGLGFLAYYNHMFSGRNMGQFSGYGLGLTYQFKAF